MAQILPPKYNAGQQIGESISQGFQNTFLPAIQQQYQQARLQDAFNKIQPGGNFLEQIKTVFPALLSTPGGAQAASEIAGPLAAISQTEGVRNAINQRRQQRDVENQPNIPSPQGTQAPTNAQPQPTAKQGIDYLNPKAPKSPLSPFPERTAGPQPQPEMSPRQMENFIDDIMLQSLNTGKPVSYAEAQNIAQQRQNLIKDSNNQILKEKQLQEAATDRLNSGMIERAQNSGLIKNPEDRTVINKFANEARNAENPEEAWEYIRTQGRRWENAQNGLLRNYQLPNPVSSSYQKMLGSYKGMEEASKQAQPFLDFYREHGLYDEARRDLSSQVGLGPEQIESWLFPLNKEQNSELKKFTPNDVKPGFRLNPFEDIFSGVFPGEKYNMSEEKFDKFKENLSNFIGKNPSINLISLRSNLNQDKRYSWQDISKAINELQNEKRFEPNPEQEKQMNIINNAPLPGLAQQFEFLWKGKK